MTQFVPVGPIGTSAVFGRMSGRIAPVGVAAGAGNSGGFVLTMAFGRLTDFSDEPVWLGCSGETRSEGPSGSLAVAGGSGRVVSEGAFGVVGPAGGSDST